MGKVNDNIKSGEECCKLANQRFGLTSAIEMLLTRFKCCDNTKEHLVMLAKDRKLIEFQSLLAQIGSNDCNIPNYVTIKEPRNFKELAD